MAHGDRKYHKHRGCRNQGYGSPKKHRGAGSRGGRGNAGSKKQKWSWFSKYRPDHIGQRGFKRPQSVVSREETINVGTLDKNLDKLMSEKKVEVKGKKIYIDLKSMGYHKLLGSGTVSNSFIIRIDRYSPKALKKVENSGGRIESTIKSPSKENES